MGRATVKTNEQGTKLVQPSKGSFTTEAQLIDGRIKPTFRATLGLLARAFVFSDVGNDFMVEAGPAGRFGIESSIGIEVATSNPNAQTFDEFESRAQVVLQVKGIVMITGDNARACQDKPVGIGNGQDIGGLGFLAALIGHRLATFLGKGMTAIQIQVMGIDLVSNLHDTLLEHARQAPVAAPLAEVVIHRPPRNRILPINRHLMPLAACVQAIQHVIEHLVQRNFAHIAPLGSTQIRQDMSFKLLLRYTRWDSAHDWFTFGRVLPAMMRYLPFLSKVSTSSKRDYTRVVNGHGSLFAISSFGIRLATKGLP